MQFPGKLKIYSLSATPQFKYWGSKYHRLLHNGSQQTRLFHTNFPHTSEGCMRDPSVCKGVWAFPSRNAFVRDLGDNRDRWHSASRGYGGFTKTMPLRSLTFKNFSVRWCLAPLIRKLRFYLNLEDLDLKMLNLDCLDLCSVLEALHLLRR